MNRVAVFVDAGYLFAAGSAALTGSKKPRQHLVLNKGVAIEKMKELASAKTHSAELLRIYWYDGAGNYRGPTTAQSDLAYRDDVKLRLGFINSQGQQKGVDSLIVTDLIELARNQSICDAVLLSGDEDVRIGVQIAQNYGVRVHLVGIEPSRGSQSNQLLQESDTCTEWDKITIGNILTYNEPITIGGSETIAGSPVDSQKISSVVEKYLATLDTESENELKASIEAQNSIPADHDGRILAQCRDEIGRSLMRNEMQIMRTRVRSILKTT